MTAPVPMVEKVARALRAKLEEGLGAATADWINEDDLARAALAAMREPTEAMVRACPESHVYEPDPRASGHFVWRKLMSVGPREQWRAMIDAALSDTDGTR